MLILDFLIYHVYFRFYWMVNLGSIIAFTGVAYIQQNISFFWGYLIPAVSMILALAVFVGPKNLYIKTNPNGMASDSHFSTFYDSTVP